jgi:acyl dehydratase
MNEYRWEDLSPGMAAGFQTTITGQMLDTFGALSGDMNPLHTDESFARSRGFEGAVVHGPAGFRALFPLGRDAPSGQGLHPSRDQGGIRESGVCR